jgi:ComF family protein
MRFFKDLFSLFYPNECAICGNSLHRNEKCLCLECFYSMPETNYHLTRDNMLTKLFWGKIPLESAAAFYYFSKGGKVQKLIHKMKYKGHKEIGEYLGTAYGAILSKSEFFRNIDVILPVPLYKKKERKRGYNQSTWFARGLSQSMKIPFNDTELHRIRHSDTQTNKNRYERWKNVKEIFVVRNSEQLEGKHILLVDDVITTGATIEASAKALLSIPNVKLSVAAIAFAGG